MTGPDFLRGQRLVVELPDRPAEDLLAHGEVFCQEHLLCWTVSPAGLASLGGLRAVFGHRVEIGVRDVVDNTQVAAARDAGAGFLTSPVADPGLLEAAADTPLVLGGLTPQELRTAAALSPQLVQVIPCDVLGTAYSRSLPALFPELPLMATGRLERFQVEGWLQAGALAVTLVGAFDRELDPEADLDALRRRCQTFDFRDL